MIGVLLLIIKVLLGMGLAGILIIIGIIATVTWAIKGLVSRIYYKLHTRRKRGAVK